MRSELVLSATLLALASACGGPNASDPASTSPSPCPPEPDIAVEGGCFSVAGSAPVSAFVRVEPSKMCPGGITTICAAPFGLELRASTDASGPPTDASYLELAVQIGTYGKTTFTAGTGVNPAGDAAFVFFDGLRCNTTPSSPYGPGHSTCVDVDPDWASSAGDVTCETSGEHVACRFQALTVTDKAGQQATASGFVHGTFKP
jgi:hypothetical protein